MVVGYCLGFVFDPTFQNVLLIQKTKPKWMNGFFNGIGGHIEEGETALDAMIRETEEETGLVGLSWRPMMTVHGNDFEMGVFGTATEYIQEARDLTEEKLSICDVRGLSTLKCLPNLRWMIPYTHLKMAGQLDGEFTVLHQERRNYAGN